MKYRCVCCGYKTLKYSNALEHEICPVCFWENDPKQNEDPNYLGGPNKVTLNQARLNFKMLGACDFDAKLHVRNPFEDEL